jgi:hypothetical protein
MVDHSLASSNEALEQRILKLEAAGRRRRKFWLGAALVAALGLGAPVRAQLGQLIELKPGTPARASDVNANFQLLWDMADSATSSAAEAAADAIAHDTELKTSLEASIAAKVGPVGQPLTIAGVPVTRWEITGETTVSAALRVDVGEWGASDTRDLLGANDGICWLTQNMTQNTIRSASGDDFMHERCSVVQEGGLWRVRATLARNYHQYTTLNISCSARCLRWR